MAHHDIKTRIMFIKIPDYLTLFLYNLLMTGIELASCLFQFTSKDNELMFRISTKRVNSLKMNTFLLKVIAFSHK